jgi:eukaryotic-like serine/threonine-protein kinase
MPLACPPPTRIGRYAIFDEIASGGMATVHLARLAGPVGFSRVVAVKRLHAHLTASADFTAMFVDEARLAARIRHPNVVPILDVLVNEGEILIVMEYVHGESLAGLRRAGRKIDELTPLAVAGAIMSNVLQGLSAAHEARDEKGAAIGLIHRDVSPQNIILGADGVARLLDFGVARAAAARRDSVPGRIKGKFSYLAPEVLRGQPMTAQVDIFAAAIVFWELITGKKLFGGATEQERMQKILRGDYPAPSALVPSTPEAVDRIVMKGLEPDVRLRYRTAHEMAVDLDNTLSLAPQRIVSEWVSRLAHEALEKRSELLQRIEVSKISTLPPPPSPEAQARGAFGEYALGVTQPPQEARRSRRGWVTFALALGIAAAGVVLGLKLHSASRATTAVGAPPPEPSSTVAAVASAAPFPSASAPAETVRPADAASTGSNAFPANQAPQRAQQPTRRPPAKTGHGKPFLPSEL